MSDLTPEEMNAIKRWQEQREFLHRPDEKLLLASVESQVAEVQSLREELRKINGLHEAENAETHKQIQMKLEACKAVEDARARISVLEGQNLAWKDAAEYLMTVVCNSSGGGLEERDK